MRTKLLLFSLTLLLGSCHSIDSTAPSHAVLVAQHTIEPEFAVLLASSGNSASWCWEKSGDTGFAELELSSNSYSWKLNDYNSHRKDSSIITLQPENTLTWHCLTTTHAKLVAGLAPPLPVLQIDSTEYTNLHHFLVEMTSPRYNSVVTHWVGEPIPVQVDNFVSGFINLSDALSHATNIWNEAFGYTVFEVNQFIPWGVRLIYTPGMQSPPLYIRGVRLDDSGHPMLMHIHAGDNYSNNHTNIWINRAMVHELAHAACLWGHSRDRNHILWENGPIVDTPSDDEIRAIRLWRAMPDGTSLLDYSLTDF
ncbi:MAG: hypothetical protein GY752_10510 [bacterium]|nr:hypothetical protein [bacterium]MCP4798694.1 hypothetical protein [bacterium]